MYQAKQHVNIAHHHQHPCWSLPNVVPEVLSAQNVCLAAEGEAVRVTQLWESEAQDARMDREIKAMKEKRQGTHVRHCLAEATKAGEEYTRISLPEEAGVIISDVDCSGLPIGGVVDVLKSSIHVVDSNSSLALGGPLDEPLPFGIHIAVLSLTVTSAPKQRLYAGSFLYQSDSRS